MSSTLHEVSTTLREVLTTSVRPNAIALRTVQTDSESFLELVESIKVRGILQTISVRIRQDPDTQEEYYELIDGLHRHTAAIEAGLKTIKVNILDLEDAEVQIAQIIANVHNIKTQPSEFSKQIRRIVASNFDMSLSDLARQLGKNTQWIQDRLNLNKITNESIMQLIDKGDIPLSKAFSLAKLPPEEQPDWVDRAMSEPAGKFCPAINERIKAIKASATKGEKAADAEFSPVGHMRKFKVITAVHTDETRETAKAVIARAEITDPIEAFQEGIAWALHLDAASVDIQKAEHEARLASREEAKKRKKEERAERTQKKAAEAQEAARAAALEAGIPVDAPTEESDAYAESTPTEQKNNSTVSVNTFKNLKEIENVK